MLSKINSYAPQIVVFLLMSTLCMTYFADDVVMYQNIVYLLVFVLCLFSPRDNVEGRYSNFYKLMVVFVILYSLRAFIELEVLGHKQELYGNNFTVYYFLFYGMFLPAIFIPKMKFDKTTKWWLVLIGVLIAISLTASAFNILRGNIVLTNDQRIQGNERLSVIQYGHLGLTSVLIGVAMYLKNNIKFGKYISLACIILGVFTMVVSGTRGAIISALFILAFYVFANARMRTFFIVLVGILILYFSLDNIISFMDSLGSNSAARIFRLFTEGGDQSSGRTEIWSRAINEIIESPLLGVSCFLHSNNSDITYVHNSFIEVTYALGIFGLFVFTKANWLALMSCLQVLRSGNTEMLIFTFLFLQYFTYCLFSDSIIRMPLYWVFLFIMLGYKYKTTKKYEK